MVCWRLREKYFPETKYQRCTVHFYRNVFSVTPRCKVKLVAKMLKAIHAQESKKAAREKAKAVVEQLRSMKLKEAAKKVEDSIEETLTYCDFRDNPKFCVTAKSGANREKFIMGGRRVKRLPPC